VYTGTLFPRRTAGHSYMYALLWKIGASCERCERCGTQARRAAAAGGGGGAGVRARAPRAGGVKGVLDPPPPAEYLLTAFHMVLRVEFGGRPPSAPSLDPPDPLDPADPRPCLVVLSSLIMWRVVWRAAWETNMIRYFPLTPVDPPQVRAPSEPVGDRGRVRRDGAPRGVQNTLPFRTPFRWVSGL
jgi:hypothetical protein